MAQVFDADRLVLTGDAQPIAEHMETGAYAVADFSVSPSGVLAYRTADPGKHELAWYDRTGNQAAVIGERPGSTRNNVRLSPDGKSLAFTRDGDDSDVWLYDLSRRVASRFTFGGGHSPMWSPDSTQIAFVRHDTIYRKRVIGESAEIPIWRGEGLLAITDWSADGRYLLIQRWDTRQGLDGRGLWLLPNPLDDHATHEPTQFESPALHGQFAPATGAPRWISYDADEGGVSQTFVRTMPGGAAGKWQVSIDGGLASRWRRDGRELYFIGNLKSLMTVDVDEGPVFHTSSPRRLFDAPPAILVALGQYAPGYDVTADGKQFVTTFPTPETPPSSITIVFNWMAALKK
jgi:Tol biopolymer transport system component